MEFALDSPSWTWHNVPDLIVKMGTMRKPDAWTMFREVFKGLAFMHHTDGPQQRPQDSRPYHPERSAA